MEDPSALVARIERHRLLVDAALPGPARWRGLLRRELCGPPQLAVRACVAWVFDTLARRVAAGDTPPLDLAFIKSLHAAAAGGPGLRTRASTRLGKQRLPPPHRLDDLVAALLPARSAEPAAIHAARVHIGLVMIHPFSDGNGRTARLAAAYVLMRAGFRSTLFTAVDQHFTHAPAEYFPALNRVRDGTTAEEACILAFLQAMARRSARVAWLRERDERLRRLRERAGLPPERLRDALVACAAGGPGGALAERLQRRLARWTKAERSELFEQLQRIQEEETGHGEPIERAATS